MALITHIGAAERPRAIRSPAVLARLRPLALALILPGLVLALWWIAAAEAWLPPQILPDPAYTFGTALDLIGSGQLGGDLWISFTRVALGLAIGGSAGVALGLLLGLSPTADAYLGPTIRAICLVPTIAWLPFFMLLFGIGEPLKLAVIAKASFLPLMLNGHAAIRATPARYLEVARVLELSRAATLRLVILPSILPALFTGLRQSLGQAWKALVVVEMVASAAGIGHLMSWGRTLFQLDIVFVAMAVIGIAGGSMDWLMRRVERRLGGTAS